MTVPTIVTDIVDVNTQLYAGFIITENLAGIQNSIRNTNTENLKWWPW